MSAGWLLVLGSDAGSQAPIDATLAQLRELGPVQALTPARRSRDADGSGRWFTNRLVRLDSAARGRTLVLATHKLREAQLADRLLWVEQGRVVSEALRGTPPFEAALARLRQDG